MLEKMEAGEMDRLGKEIGAKVVKNTFAFLGLEFNLESLIQHYFQPLSSYSNWYTFNLAGTGSNRKLLFEHQYGSKWSIFLKQYIGAIIKSATGREPRITIDDDLVTVFVGLEA